MISSSIPQWNPGPFYWAGIHWERKIPKTLEDYHTVLTDIQSREMKHP